VPGRLMEPALSTPRPRASPGLWPGDRTRDAADYPRALLLPPEICCYGGAGRAVGIEITARRPSPLRNLTVIRTRAHHRAALREIEGLMDAKPNTARGRRLDVLTRLVEAYESRHYPIEPPSRVAVLRYHAESRPVPRAQARRGSKAKPAARKTKRHQ